jgi:hypothetical protein
MCMTDTVPGTRRWIPILEISRDDTCHHHQSNRVKVVSNHMRYIINLASRPPTAGSTLSIVERRVQPEKRCPEPRSARVRVLLP